MERLSCLRCGGYESPSRPLNESQEHKDINDCVESLKLRLTLEDGEAKRRRRMAKAEPKGSKERWRLVAENMPPAGEDVLVFGEGYGYFIAHLQVVREGEPVARTWKRDNQKVTFAREADWWIPLPSPPFGNRKFVPKGGVEGGVEIIVNFEGVSWTGDEFIKSELYDRCMQEISDQVLKFMEDKYGQI